MRSSFSSAFAPILIFLAKTGIADDIVWAAATTSIKISIVHFYITVFRSNRTFLKIAYAVMALLSAFGVAVVILILVFNLHFKARIPLEVGFYIAVSSGNMTIDMIVILLPMPIIWGLQMATRRKFKLTVVFALGCMYAL